MVVAPASRGHRPFRPPHRKTRGPARLASVHASSIVAPRTKTPAEEGTLKIEIVAPDETTVGDVFTCVIVVRNAGGQKLNNVNVIARYDAALTPLRLTEGYQRSGSGVLTWKCDELPPGQKIEFSVEYRCDRASPKACFMATVTSQEAVFAQASRCQEIREGENAPARGGGAVPPGGGAVSPRAADPAAGDRTQSRNGYRERSPESGACGQGSYLPDSHCQRRAGRRAGFGVDRRHSRRHDRRARRHRWAHPQEHPGPKCAFPAPCGAGHRQERRHTMCACRRCRRAITSSVRRSPPAALMQPSAAKRKRRCFEQASRAAHPRMPRFVILRHDSPRGLHWDFMLECGAALKTWALAQPPGAALQQWADALPDHRLHYLQYEGPLSGDRGSVRRHAEGSYCLVQQSEQCWQVRLEGGELQGLVTLVQSPDQPARWRLRYEP